MIVPMPKPFLLTLLLGASALLTACGGDSDNDRPATSKPAAPTVSATVSTKALRLDWNTVAGAEHYRIYQNRDGNSGYSLVQGELNRTTHTLPLAAHLFDWEEGRVMVEACNSHGCSASTDVFISEQVLGAIGYLKAEEPTEEALFGFALAMAGDGKTLAVGAPQFDHKVSLESGSSETARRSGAVYIYRAGQQGWSLAHTLTNPARQFGNWHLFGYSLAFSEDGALLAVSAPSEDNRGNRLNNDDSNPWIHESGAVYMFAYDSSQGWQQQAYIKSPNVQAEQFFGIRVALSPEGNRLAVGAPYEASKAAGVNGDQTDASIPQAGAVYVYDYQPQTGQWQDSAYLKPSTASPKEQPCFEPRPGNNPCYSRSPSRFGSSLAFAQNGTMLAVGAPGDSSISGGINGVENDYRGKSSGAVYILRFADNQWRHTDYIKAAYPRIDDEFGYSLSLSANGQTLAVGAPYDDNALEGLFDTSASTEAIAHTEQSTTDSGAAYVFHHTDDGWQQSLYLKPEAAVTDGYFGWSLSLSAVGDYLAVGTPRDRSSGTGVGSDRLNTNANNSGAAYVYYQPDSAQPGDWSLVNYIKASNTDSNDTFGRSLLLSADAETLAAAATGEDSSSSGVNGEQHNDNRSNAGAVYLY